MTAIPPPSNANSSPRPVVVVGSVNADCVIEVPRLPQRGETIAASRADTGRFFPGGKGANQVAAAARLLQGAATAHPPCRFIGQFGRDAHGVTLERALTDLGVDTSLAGHPDCPSGQAFVFVYPDGDNSIVIVGGANATWPSDGLPPATLRAIQSAAIVLLQCEIPAEVNYAVTRHAAAANVPVLFDLGGEERTIPWEVLQYITYLCPNKTELARLVDRELSTTAEVIDAARWLQGQGANHILVTLGSEGSCFVPKEADGEIVHQPCLVVPEDAVVDTTGAGDCFRGAFAVAVAENKSVKESLAFAAAASALCVQVQGAMPSMPTAEATLELMRSTHAH